MGEEETVTDEEPRGMSPAEFLAHRLDVWDFAYERLLGGPTAPRSAPNWGDYVVDPADVLILARFLDADDVAGSVE